MDGEPRPWIEANSFDLDVLEKTWVDEVSGARPIGADCCGGDHSPVRRRARRPGMTDADPQTGV